MGLEWQVNIIMHSYVWIEPSHPLVSPTKERHDASRHCISLILEEEVSCSCASLSVSVMAHSNQACLTVLFKFCDGGEHLLERCVMTQWKTTLSKICCVFHRKSLTPVFLSQITVIFSSCHY